MSIAKDILDKYANLVIPKTTENIGYNPKLKRPYFVKAFWRRKSEDFKYSKIGYNENLCLWIPPEDCLVIEFEGTLQENKDWISKTIENCKKYGLDYCKGDHTGKSAYVWIFNIEGLKDNLQKKALAKLLIPKDAKLDFTNLGQTLVPVIEHKHWKYGLTHQIIEGKNPINHKNTLPKEAKLSFQNADKVLISTASTLAKSMDSTLSNKSFFSCDGYSSNDNKISQILKTDFKVQHLLAGELGKYDSPSNARLALYCCLVAYGLDDKQVFSIMNLSHGLNYHEKLRLQQYELDKARKFVTKQREIYGGIENGSVLRKM